MGELGYVEDEPSCCILGTYTRSRSECRVEKRKRGVFVCCRGTLIQHRFSATMTDIWSPHEPQSKEIDMHTQAGSDSQTHMYTHRVFKVITLIMYLPSLVP